MSELNPDHPTTRAVHDQWHKLCCLLMIKFGRKDVVFTNADVEKFVETFTEKAIVCDTRNGMLALRIVSMEEGERLAREEGGLPS